MRLTKDQKHEFFGLLVWGILGLVVMFVMMSLAGCSSPQYVPVGSNMKIVEKETFVPMPVPADSASIRALLQCDKNGKVVLEWFDTEKSKNVQLQFSIDSLGNLLAKMKSVPDTIYVPIKETTIEKEIKVPYPVEKELTRWQKIKIELGDWAFSIIIVFILIMIYKIILCRINK